MRDLNHICYNGMQMGKLSPGREKTTSQTSLFITMALDMTWRLAVVVLVPIIGGFYLDKGLDSTPVFIIIGFVLAMVGMAMVFWQTLQTASKIEVPKATSSNSTKSPKKDKK